MNRHIAKRLKDRRILVGLSQDQLASSVGVSFQQVQKYEYGVSSIAASMLYRLAAALGVSPDYFFSATARPDHPNHEFDPQVLTLLRYYWRIRDARRRESILTFFTSLAEQHDPVEETAQPLASVEVGLSPQES